MDANLLLVGSGIMGLVVLLFRQTIISFFTAKTQIIAAEAQNNTFERLQSEIVRLETIIIKQALRIEELDARLRRFTVEEARDAADLAVMELCLNEIRQYTPPSPKWAIVLETLHRMKDRKTQEH